MAKKHACPHRALNSRVSLDFKRFGPKLVRALGVEGAAVANQFIEGKPFEDWERPDRGSDPCRFSSTYLLGMILSKLDDGKPSEAKTDKTWRRFFEAEETCRQTNEFLLKDKPEWPHLSKGGVTVASVLHTARQKISGLLGEFDWNEASDGFAFGPGASTRLPRKKADTAYKFSGSPETTFDNLALASAVIQHIPLWRECVHSDGGALTIVRGNKVITVPKSYKTDRTIAVEPDMNMFVQKGIGAMIRRRLKRVGVDLDSQLENQHMARLGSMFDNLATVDLSMASDTVSLEIVRQLLPPDWWLALEQCRSPCGVLPSGVLLEYQKFSSMGNGYTFELESLLFWALALSVLELTGVEDRRLAVYGDDIIIAASAVPDLSVVLTTLGFKFNEEKSHVEGPFRESCGKHFLSGYDVTPFFLRNPVSDLTDLFLLHNNLYRWCVRNQWNKSWDRHLMKDLLKDLRGHAPSNWRRPRMTDGFGDGAFIGTFDEVLPSRVVPKFGSYKAKVLVEQEIRSKEESLPTYISSLYRLEQRNPSNRVSSSRRGHLDRVEQLLDPPVHLGPGRSLGQRFRIKEILIPQCVLLSPFRD